MKSTEDQDHGCSHCVKSFSSLKALHGHMRLHKERPWRGMQPPTPATLDSSSPLPSWIKTAKRGRPTVSTDASSSPSSSDTSSAGSGHDMPVAQQPPYKMRKTKLDQLKSRVSNLDSSVIPAKHHEHHHQAQLKNVNIPKKSYRCNSCDKEFTSHQALGGHKSGHNKTTTVSGSTKLPPTQRRKVLDIDLNELPPMDKDE